MIAASEPLEFIPRGRQAVDEHPGPFTVKQPVAPTGTAGPNSRTSSCSSSSHGHGLGHGPINTSPQAHHPQHQHQRPPRHNATGASESMLMHRMQSVNISIDTEAPPPPVYQESWLLEEVVVYPAAAADDDDWMTDAIVNTEHELYHKGYTAVWSQGLGADGVVLPRTCFTCDTPITHSFFCEPAFVQEKRLGADKRGATAAAAPVESVAPLTAKKTTPEIPGVCLIDATALHVYLSNGEHFLTSLEFAVSQVWTSRFGILLEKTASTAKLPNATTVPMPRLFSLSHPLEEMCPVLVRPLIGTMGYMLDTDYRVVYTDARTDLVLMYDNKMKKHFVSRLRRATEEEANAICANDTMQTDIFGCSASMQPGATSMLKMFGASNKQNVSHGAFNSKLNFSPANRTAHSSFATKLFNASGQPLPQPANASGTGSRAGAGFAAHSFVSGQRSFVNSPRDRFQATFGSGTLAGSFGGAGGGAGSIAGGFGSMHTLGGGDVRADGIGMDGDGGRPALAKPIAPELCLEYLWIDSNYSNENGEIASSCFLHTDLVGRHFMAYMLTRTGRLQLLRLDTFDKVNKKGLVASIAARDAVVLPHMNLFAVLDLSGTLLLYSGCVQIGKVHVGGVLSSRASISGGSAFGTPAFPRRSSLLPTTSAEARLDDDLLLHSLSPVQPLQHQHLHQLQQQQLGSGSATSAGGGRTPIGGGKGVGGHNNSGFCVSLRDATGNRLTLVYPGGRMYRVAIPLIAECPFVAKCLRVLRAVLPSPLAMLLLVRWYGTRNAPGTRDLNPLHEWTMLVDVLAELIGRPARQSAATPAAAAAADHPANVSADYGGAGAGAHASHSVEEPKKRRKSDTCEGTDDDWEFLLGYVDRASAAGPAHGAAASVAASAKTAAACSAPFARYNTGAALFDKLPLVFVALHLFYEDQKLCAGEAPLHVRSLGELLYRLSMDLQLDGYSLHYFCDQPALIYVQSASILTDVETRQMNHKSLLGGPVAGVLRHLCAVVSDEAAGRPKYPWVRGVNDRSRQIVALTNLIQSGVCTTAADPTVSGCIEQLRWGSAKAAGADDAEPVDAEFAEFGETGVPLRQRVVRAFLRLGIGRSDIDRLPLAVQLLFVDFLEECRCDASIERSDPAVCELLLRPELLAHARFEADEAESNKPNRTFRNVQREHSLSPRVPATPDVIPRADGAALCDDGMDQMDTKLLRLLFPNDLRTQEVRRLLASSRPVTIDIVQALGVSDHDFIEEQERQLFAVCTRTMALPMGRAMFSMRTCTPIATESLTIPKLCLSGRESSKGAAVELQQIEVPANMNQWPLYHNGVAAGLQITAESRDVDSTWIVYNKPKVLPEGSAEHGGFLMALGLNGHLKSLTFMVIYEYLVKCEEMTSIGLLLGIAAAHAGTQDVTSTKLLSVHIEALLPATALELDIPQNMQVAAIMGVGLVYRGSAKRHMAEVLLQEIGRPPGPEMENCVERESYALTAGLALGLVTLGLGEAPPGLRDLQLPDTLHYYMVGGKRRGLSGAQRDKYKLPSFQVREGDAVNIDVTAPGATLALGLMFFGTGNAAVANWMRPPETSYLLDLVRPDLLLLRVIARGLIQWHDVSADDAWLWSQFPESLRFDAAAGPADADDMDVDHEANCQAYCNILAGAAMCIGLKYAGTADRTVFVRLRQMLDVFLLVPGRYIGMWAGKATIESCLVLVLLALSMVYAGTGNLEILRICRMMRARLGTGTYLHVTYGSQMAIHMAIGFLFLGAGRFTLLRTKEAVAALVCALFPKFPTHSNDNRYHLQAFRHLYVLAVEPRMLMPRDIDSGQLCWCNLTYVKLDSPNVAHTALAPCILPELHNLKSVEIDDANYWPIRFDRSQNWEVLEVILRKSGCVDLKRKAGCLSHVDDPHRLRSLFAQTLTTEQYSCWAIEPRTLLSFSNDELVANFIRIYLEPHRPRTCSLPLPTGPELEVQQQIMLQFYNSLTQDRIHALPIYMNLLLMLRRNLEQPLTVDVWQLKIIAALLQRQQRSGAHAASTSGGALLSGEIVGSLLERFAGHMDALSHMYRAQLKQFLYASSCQFLMHYEPARLADIVALLTYYELPMNVMAQLQHGLASSAATPLNYLKLLLELSPLRLSTATVRCIAQCTETL